MGIQVQISQATQAPDERRGHRVEQGDRQRADGRHGQKRKLEAGLEHLVRIQHEIQQGDGSQQVQYACAAIEKTRHQIQRKTAGGAHHGRLPARDQRIEPPGRGRQEQSRDFGKGQQAEKEKQAAG